MEDARSGITRAVAVAALLVGALVLALRGCGGPDVAAPRVTAPAGEIADDEREVSPRSAAGLVEALAERMYQVERIRAGSGGAGSARSTASFSDSRLVDDDADDLDDDDTARGGRVEVFGSGSAARDRRDDLEGGPEHVFVYDRAVLRVTGRLDEAVAREYEAAWPDVVAGRSGH